MVNIKTVLIHDHRYFIYNQNFYGNGSIGNSAIERYKSSFKNFSIASRHKYISDLDQVTNLEFISKEDCNFIELDDFLSLKKIYKFPKFIRKLKQVIIEYDAIIIRLPSFMGYFAAYYAKKYNKPTIIEVVGSVKEPLKNKNFLGCILGFPLEIVMKKIVYSSKFTMYVTEEYLQKNYPSNGLSINASNVNISDYVPVKAKNKAEKYKLLNDKDKIILGSIGNIELKYKGHYLVIRNIKNIEKIMGKKVEYQIVGGGNQEYLNSLIKELGVEDKVILTGQKNRKEIFEWLDSIDFYLQPSLTEGLPRALIEAMSRGLVCFGSSRGGIPELLETEEMIIDIEKLNYDMLNNFIKNQKQKDLSLTSRLNHKKSKRYSLELIRSNVSKFYSGFIKESFGQNEEPEYENL